MTQEQMAQVRRAREQFELSQRWAAARVAAVQGVSVESVMRAFEQVRLESHAGAFAC